MALDYSRTRRGASVGLDGLTPMLLGVFVLAMLGLGIYAQINIQNAAITTQLGESASTSLLWTAIVIYTVLAFAITGPLVLLGIFVASKIMRFVLPGGSYLRACGVAVLPVLMLFGIIFLPQNVIVLLLYIVAIPPLTFYVLKGVFELNVPEGAVSFLLGGILGVFGALLSAGIVKAVIAAGAAAAGSPGNQGLLANSINKVTLSANPMNSPVMNMPLPVAPTSGPLDALKEELANCLSADPVKSNQSRESMQRSFDELQARAKTLRSNEAFANDSGWPTIDKQLAEVAARVAAAPSETPPENLKQPFNPAKSVSAADLSQLGDEISVGTFNIRPPKSMKIRIDSTERDDKGLIWAMDSRTFGGDSAAMFTARVISANGSEQTRPWIATRSVIQAAAGRENLFAVDAPIGATTEEVRIGQLPATRLLPPAIPSDNTAAARSTKYIARSADSWIVLTLTPSSKDTSAAVQLDSAARSLRVRGDGEMTSEPISAEYLASRLTDDPKRAANMLRARGASAEEALIAVLTGEPFAARQAAEILGDIGTDKSVPALREASKSSDSQLADAARASLKKIKPEQIDVVAETLLVLQSDNTTFKKKDALAKLAIAPVDEKRREDVATALEECITGKDAFFIGDAAADALVNWMGKNTVVHLLPLLDENAQIHSRKAAMQVLGASKDKRAVFPICRWILKDGDSATEALIAMGPVAEDEVLKLIRDKDGKIRNAAAKVLQGIGTQKSLGPLKRASADQRDSNAAATARIAYDVVADRVKNNPTTKPGH